MQDFTVVYLEGRFNVNAENEKLLRIKDLARLLDVHRSTIHRWIRLGKLETVILPSGRKRIPEGTIRRFRCFGKHYQVTFPMEQECESCAENGDHGVPAVGHSVNPEWSGYWLCRACIGEYDARPPVNQATG